jgi:hypothetical protein
LIERKRAASALSLRSIARRAASCNATRDTSARLYQIDHLSLNVKARSIALEEAGHLAASRGTREEAFPLWHETVVPPHSNHVCD